MIISEPLLGLGFRLTKTHIFILSPPEKIVSHLYRMVYCIHLCIKWMSLLVRKYVLLKHHFPYINLCSAEKSDKLRIARSRLLNSNVLGRLCSPCAVDYKGVARFT